MKEGRIERRKAGSSNSGVLGALFKWLILETTDGGELDHGETDRAWLLALPWCGGLLGRSAPSNASVTLIVEGHEFMGTASVKPFPYVSGLVLMLLMTLCMAITIKQS